MTWIAARWAAVKRWFAGIPLRVRLVAITSLVLVVGLTVAGVASVTFLERDLMSRLDDQLTSQSMVVAQRVGEEYDQAQAGITVGPFFPNNTGGQQLPSDYYVQISASNGEVLYSKKDSRGADNPVPVLPVITIDQLRAGSVEQPYTVPSADGSQRWRVVALTRSSDSTIAQVALPMTSVDSTVEQLRLLLISSAAIVVVIGSAIGYFAVRRSLRPLHDVEKTAKAIAEGDLSQRVPELPTTTEVGQVSAALNTMLTQIEVSFDAQRASEERMRRFVADASHELRTPLASVRGFGELYRMGAIPPDEVGGSMKRIEDEAIRMGSLVEDLLALARLDEKRPMKREPVDLTVLAADAAQDAHALAPDRAVKVVRVSPAAASAGEPHDQLPVFTLGDERSLRQVVSNLVGNAVNHTPAGTPIEILVGSDAVGQVVLAVRDHGPGIDPSEARRIFERFYRTDSSRVRGAGGGSGLGLAIATAIATAHDGVIEVSETTGGGATMSLRLPAMTTPDGTAQ